MYDTLNFKCIKWWQMSNLRNFKSDRVQISYTYPLKTPRTRFNIKKEPETKRN